MFEGYGQGQRYHEDHSDEENEGGEELQTQWDQPCSVGLSLSSTADIVRACVTIYQLWYVVKQQSSQTHRNRSRRRS